MSFYLADSAVLPSTYVKNTVHLDDQKYDVIIVEVTPLGQSGHLVATTSDRYVKYVLAPVEPCKQKMFEEAVYNGWVPYVDHVATYLLKKV